METSYKAKLAKGMKDNYYGEPAWYGYFKKIICLNSYLF
jgi:hypothetical protein